MKRKPTLRLMALLAALAGLLGGCAPAPGPADSTVPSRSETAPAPTAPAPDELNVWCFRAGKADAFLFWNEAGAVLIDAGESGFGKTVLAKLEELGIGRLDYLIVTHFDKDHVGGAKKLLNSIPVGTVLQSNCPKSGADAYEGYLQALEKNGITPVTVREQTGFRLGEAVFTVDPPAQELYAEEASNNSSLIVSVACGGKRLLFLGDAMELRLREYLETAPGRFDFVKLPHHGTFLPALEPLLEQTAPRYALITSSEEEPEDEQTLRLLSSAGAEVFLTRLGPVALRVGPDGLDCACAP